MRDVPLIHRSRPPRSPTTADKVMICGEPRCPRRLLSSVIKNSRSDPRVRSVSVCASSTTTTETMSCSLFDIPDGGKTVPHKLEVLQRTVPTSDDHTTTSNAPWVPRCSPTNRSINSLSAVRPGARWVSSTSGSLPPAGPLPTRISRPSPAPPTNCPPCDRQTRSTSGGDHVVDPSVGLRNRVAPGQLQL
jgi:hypothetical protein